MASPRRSIVLGVRRATAPPASSTSPAWERRQPITACASSVRPAPMRPASPTISPWCTSSDASMPRADRPLIDKTTGAPSGGLVFGGKVASRERPSIPSISDFSFSFAHGRTDDSTVSQHGYIVGELEHLAQDVRNEHDRAPPVAERTDGIAQGPISSRVRAALGSSMTTSSASERRPQDLQLLLVGCPQVPGDGAGGIFEAHRPRQGRVLAARCAGGRSHASGGRPPGTRFRPPKAQAYGELSGDGGHAMVERLPRGLEVDGAAADKQLAAVGDDDAR